jgi:hypothetical protein
MLDFLYFLRHFAVAALTILFRNMAPRQFAIREQSFPALNAFFSRCVLTIEPGTTCAGWICASFGVKRQRDWPAGAILAQAADMQDGSTFWLCAQPVHLRIERDDLLLLPPSKLRLSAEESRTLLAFLQPYCANHGLQLGHVDTGLWCIGASRAQSLCTTEIELAQGHSLNDLLPTGDDGPFWQRLVTELQMVLHEHPVNMAREQRDEPLVNSVWLWGGGTACGIHRHFDRMKVTDPLLRASARLSGAQLAQSACNFDDLISVDAAPGQHSMVEFDFSSDSEPAGTLSRLESDWMALAWQALGEGRLDELTVVVVADPGRLLICRCDRKARRRFWKRSKPFDQQLDRWQLER